MRKRRTSRSIKYKGVRIRRRGRRWQVDYGLRKGRRVQRSFTTKKAAKGDVDEHLAHESPEQRDIRENSVTLCHLTQHERIEVLEALDMLKGVASLRDAVGFFIQHHSAPNVSPSIHEVFGQYKEAKRKANCREWHLRNFCVPPVITLQNSWRIWPSRSSPGYGRLNCSVSRGMPDRSQCAPVVQGGRSAKSRVCQRL